MSQIELQEQIVDNNEQDDDNFSIVDGVEELCLDASGEIEKLQGSQEQHKWDEIAEKLAALEQKHHDEIAELKIKNLLLTEENKAFGVKLNEAEEKTEKKIAEFEKKLTLLEETHHKGIAELKTKNQPQQEKTSPEIGSNEAASSNENGIAAAIHYPNDRSANLQELLDKIQSADPAVQLAAVIQVRQLLSSHVNNPHPSTVDAMINSGILAQLVKCLELPNDTLQIEAAWALANIASGTTDQTRAVVQAGAVPRLITLLESPNMNVCDQAVWALGNIIDNWIYGFADAIPLNLLRNLSWVILNLCRHKLPTKAREYVQLLVPTLDTLIQHKDMAILVDTIWSLYFLTVGRNTDDDEPGLQLAMDHIFVKQVVPLLGHTDARVQKAALVTLGKFVASGTHAQIQLVFDGVPVQMMPTFLSHLEEYILNEEVLQFISNMKAAGNGTAGR